MFPAWHIALTALATAAITTALTLVVTRGRRATRLGQRSGHTSLALGDLIGVGIATGLGVLLWRLGANVPFLNDDPIPGISPADVLSAPLAYVAADIYVRLRRVSGGASERLSVAPAMAAVVALIVNIVTI